MLPWKLRKREILPVNQNHLSVYLLLAKFQLVSWNLSLAMIWRVACTHKLTKLCSATLTSALVHPSIMIIIISNRFLENQPNEICSHLTERASKGRFLKPENGSKITVTKEKERRKRKSEEIRKGGEEKKAMVALLGNL